MTKRFLVFFELLLLVGYISGGGWLAPTKAQAPGVSADNDRSLPVIVAMKGQVSVKRRGRNQYESVMLGTSLRRGDLLRVEASSQATAVCADLKRRDVPSGFSGVPCPSAKSLRDYKGNRVLELRREISDYLHYRDNKSFPIVVSPRKTKLLNPRPALRWTPVDGATTYKVTVRGPDLEWMATNSKMEIVYPENAPTLKAENNYELIVEANGRSSSEESIPGLGFTVLSGGEAKDVREGEKRIRELGFPDALTKFLVAHLYASFELIAEAIEELEKPAKTLRESFLAEFLGNGRLAVHRALLSGDLYMAVGLNWRAEQDYRLALDISKTTEDDEGEEVLAHEALGLIYKELGIKEQATLRLESALKLYKKLKDRQATERIEKHLTELK